MVNKQKFFICRHCGNLVGMVNNAGVPMICCGAKMQELVPNTVDAAQEKHVPVLTRKGDKVLVEVGAQPHPMTAEHHIAWIAIVQENCTCRVTLLPDGAPSAELCLCGGPACVYAYCNLHGLWMAELA